MIKQKTGRSDEDCLHSVFRDQSSVICAS